MWDITMWLYISIRLTPQVTTIICHHMKKILLKQIYKKNMERLKQNSYVNKNNAYIDYTKNSKNYYFIFESIIT